MVQNNTYRQNFLKYESINILLQLNSIFNKLYNLKAN